jgi:hypothetical protein
MTLMEVIVERTNLNLAYERVKANGGAPGVDGRTVDDLKAWCQSHERELIGQLLDGSYQPQPVRGKLIPKPGGGCGFQEFLPESSRYSCRLPEDARSWFSCKRSGVGRAAPWGTSPPNPLGFTA